MSSPVIRVENVSKQYRLGEVGTGTLSHDVNRWWHKVRGKEDPYLKIGDTNDRSKKGESDYSWSLRDVSFEVKQGEVLGIIGRNGAGKSTLLKILSRVTTPTSGQIKVKGRIASLLEVGTGFHPELTGRENIYINGAILGMRKDEITRKLDEIIEFSGCERYIDTPVKRYSSGMYVRLAFAVAAHLEPEILIIDEVLAVGDAEFQKKCLGKMKAVAGEGRTVLFVSHNMGAMATLCDSCLLLTNGCLDTLGPASEGIQRYLELGSVAKILSLEDCRPVEFRKLRRLVEFVDVPSAETNSPLAYGRDLKFTLVLFSESGFSDASIGGSLFDAGGSTIGTFFTKHCVSVAAGQKTQITICLHLPELVPGHYSAGFSVGVGKESHRRKDYDVVIGMPRFEIAPIGISEIVSQWESEWGRLCLNSRVSVL